MVDTIDPHVGSHLHTVEFELAAKDAEMRLDYADRYAHAGIKSLFLVNGAAIISLLTFIGNGATEYDKRGLFWAFAWFALGLAAALLANFGAYFCQNFYMLHSMKRAWNAKYKSSGINHAIDNSKDMRIGNLWIGIAIVSAISSFLLFLLGIFVALVAIT